jgi:hypothetical protein
MLFLSLIVLFSSLAIIEGKLSFLPKEWASYEVVKSAAGTAVTGYFTQSFYSTTTCSSDTADVSESIGFGACLGGRDTNGKPTTSWISTINSFTATSITLNQHYYLNHDCSHDPFIQYTQEYSLTACDFSSKYSYSDNAVNKAPWEDATSGVVMHLFTYTPCVDHVEDVSTSGEAWTAYSAKMCIMLGSPMKNGARSMRYASCTAAGAKAEEEDTYTVEYYSDGDCQSVLKSATYPSVCMQCPANEGCLPTAYQTTQVIRCNY